MLDPVVASQTALNFYWLWHPLIGPGYQFWSGIASDLGEVTLIGGLIVAYRKIECHQTGCHRIGKFVHGHFKLCKIHHPHVPSDGKITKEHIDIMTQRKEQ